MTRILAIGSAVAVLAMLAVGHLALAQSQSEWREATERPQPNLVLNESYHGTTPGGGNTLPRVEELKGKDGNWITWPGFIMRPDGGSRVFVQTTKPLEYSRSDKKRRLSLSFREAGVHLNNNRNPLVTVHFNTPLRRAFLKRTGKAVELVMELKVEAQATITQFADSDGYHYLFVDYPAGQYPVGGDWGARPSFQGFGAPQPPPAEAPAEAQIVDEELPPPPPVE